MFIFSSSGPLCKTRLLLRVAVPWRLPRHGLGKPRNTQAMPELCAGLDWLEPEEFPAWRRRLELERRAHNLTLHRQKALGTLLAFWGAEGLFPSDGAVAGLAGISERTVRRARLDARELGLLTWQRTRKLVAGRWRQGPNRYTVTVPAGPVCSGGQAGRQRQARKKQEAFQDGSLALAEFMRDASMVPDLLAARRQANEARWLAQK